MRPVEGGSEAAKTLDVDQRIAVFDALPDSVVVLDPSFRVVWANAAAGRFIGGELAEWVGSSVIELVHPDDLEFALMSMESVQGKAVGSPVEVRVKAIGGWRLMEVIGAPVTDLGVTVLCLRDLTDRRRWEVAGDEVSMFRSLVHNGAALTMLVDTDGRVRAASAALARALGHDPEHVEGQRLDTIVHVDDRAVLHAALTGPAKPTRETVEVRLLDRNTAPVPYELCIADLRDDPTVGGFVVSGHDISRLRAAQHELEELASRDALTGLPNRAFLDRHLAGELERVRMYRAPLVVAFVDLDRFKPINDLLGHDAGDELLRTLAGRLRAAVRENDVVARFGGDEFVVVARLAAAEGPALVARLEAAVAEPFGLAKGQAQVFASVGFAAALPTHTAESLISEADGRMYAVKRSRRGNPVDAVTSVAARRLVAEELAVAIADHQLEVYYQPIVELADGTIVGHEALVRWNHPTRGLLLPAEFLGVAEDSGREVELGELVLRAACARLAELDRRGDPAGRMAVNASVGQLLGTSFVDLVASVLAAYGLTPDRLCIEITERHVLERPAAGPATSVRMTLEGLADLGVHLAIDDFGTGYSSLTHVLQFPVSVLKIDRSFVTDVTTDRQSRSVVAAVVHLARGMGLTAIAEGVEGRAQADALLGLGCTLGQGYFYGRPAPAV